MNIDNSLYLSEKFPGRDFEGSLPLEIDERKRDRLVQLCITVTARINEIEWYLNKEFDPEETIIANRDLYREKLKSIKEGLKFGLLTDLSEVDNKIKAIYSLYSDILKEITNLTTIPTTKSVEYFS